MLLAEQHISLENVIHELGYADLTSFAKQQAQEVLWKKIKDCEEKIKIYESKYQTDYQGFQDKFHAYENFGIFEKEDDGMTWETEISLKKHYLEMIQNLIG